jgi:hypothetical protein
VIVTAGGDPEGILGVDTSQNCGLGRARNRQGFVGRELGRHNDLIRRFDYCDNRDRLQADLARGRTITGPRLFDPGDRDGFVTRRRVGVEPRERRAPVLSNKTDDAGVGLIAI